MYRQPGDMGRYVAVNDPGQPFEGKSFEEYKASDLYKQTLEKLDATPVTGGTGLPEERSKRPIVQTEQQAGITDTPATLPTGTAVSPTELVSGTDEFLTTPTALSSREQTVATSPTTNLDVSIPQSKTATTYTAYTQPGTVEANAASGTLNSQAIIGNIEGAVSQASQASVVNQELDQRATVKYQLDKLFSDFQEGTELPAWASPAVRKVTAIMNQRGLGSSSMASAAITQAIMESGVAIAANDAKMYAAIQLQNLKNEQQTTLQNALAVAAMDRANVSARTNAAVTNARSFLSIDLANLTNEQKTAELNYQGTLQKMFKDQSEINASRQFNAKEQNDIDEFFDELATQVETANANRQVANEQFNADQKNAITKYYESLNDSRDKFNSNMTTQINQSNAVWRREINTANTALQNETNRLNAGNLLNLTTNAQNYLWQRYRDEASWLMSSTESAKDRAHAVAMFAQQAEFNQDTYEKQQKDLLLTELGMTVFDLIFGDN